MENTTNSCKQQVEEFVARHEIKEKTKVLLETAQQKAEEYKLKEKSIETMQKTKEFLAPYAEKAAYEAKIMGNYLWGMGVSVYYNYQQYRKNYAQTDEGSSPNNQ